MTVQFLCPSCQHPIEIDDEWASQPVACPFCRNTVTAPARSTFAPPDTTPVARAIDPDHGRIHVPTDPDADRRNPAATLALGLSVLHLIAYVGASLVASSHIVDALGDDATPAAVQQYVQDQIQQGATPKWLVPLMLMTLLSVGLWVAGLVCAIVALRRRARRGFVYAALGLLAVGPLLLCLGFVQVLG